LVAFIRLFDSWVRRAAGVFEFCDESGCLLRLRVARAGRSLSLCGSFRLAPADQVLELHLWNERIPPMPADGPDLAWASQTLRMFLTSLKRVAGWMSCDPRAVGLRAVRGTSILLFPGGSSSGVYLMERLGFEIFPYHHPLGAFGEFWENLYSWTLIWAYNRPGLHDRSFLATRRTQVYMPAQEFLRRYASREGGLP
jgi:hypothetical protein